MSLTLGCPCTFYNISLVNVFVIYDYLFSR